MFEVIKTSTTIDYNDDNFTREYLDTIALTDTREEAQSILVKALQEEVCGLLDGYYSDIRIDKCENCYAKIVCNDIYYCEVEFSIKDILD